MKWRENMAMKALAFRPVGVPFFTAARRMFPVEMVGMPSFWLIISAWVPFPAPGAPKRMIFIAFPFSLTPGSPYSAA